MKTLLLGTGVLAGLLGSPLFQVPAARETPATAEPDTSPRRQFDFWVGEWDCFGRDGQQAGTNRIVRLEGGAALQEFWSGAGGGTGTSLNFYDAARGVWHQTWIDASGGALFLEGGLQDDGSMLLTGTRPGPEDTELNHKITWTPGSDGSVQQTWLASKDGGATWNTAADLRYLRRTPPAQGE